MAMYVHFENNNNCISKINFFLQAKEKLETLINNYIYVHLHMAGKAICIAAQNKISNNDVILTYG